MINMSIVTGLTGLGIFIICLTLGIIIVGNLLLLLYRVYRISKHY